jgi:AcrR family transcriptional regulator
VPRPSKANERRQKLLPQLAEAFGELGYRRATTAELAARCDVQETILYRLWPGKKKAMFVAAVDYLFQRRMAKWEAALAEAAGSDESRAARLIRLTGRDLGEQGLYRVIFTALDETDDPDIRQALQRLYRQYHVRVAAEVTRHRECRGARNVVGANDTAWALIGLVTFMNNALHLDLMSAKDGERLFGLMAFALLDGAPR